MSDYLYQLEKYHGPGSRYTCPYCGRKRCFTRYINTQTGEYVDETCGRCDHESSCGKNVTPSQFFRDHPNFDNPYKKEYRPLFVQQVKPKTKPICEIPYSYVEKSHQPTSNFMKWVFKTFGDTPEVLKVYEDYKLGATQSNGVIYWQIDIKDRVRTGKVMHYMPDGHRTNYSYFIHDKLKKRNELSTEWELTQCLFGEHLIKLRPDAMIFLVESEKSAIVGAIRYPQFLWIASGGSNGLNKEKLAPLRGRRVRVFPDSGEYDKWKEVMSETEGIDYTIVKDLENYTHNTDIVDLLLS